jgi:hypothetical protein
MSVHVVTTCSPAGYDAYGRKFVSSFLEHAPETPLVVYHESMDTDVIAPSLDWRNLDRDSDRARFIAEHGQDPLKVGTWHDPNSQSIRFCHKVFAVTHAATISQADWLVWIDSDVVLTASPDWSECLPTGKDLSFLGRKFPYTECGFVGYHIANPLVRKMVDDMRSYYTSGEIFTHPKKDWHDSRCFDICRERSGIPLDRQHSLSAHVIGTHVWPHTALAKWSVHNKGPGRKRGAYGVVVS